MSIKTFDSALDFVPAKSATHKSGIWSATVDTFKAIHEGMTLANEYKELTSRGMAPDAAARQVFNQIAKAA